MTSKGLVIYHANCTDGFTSAWCFYHHQKTMPVTVKYDYHPGNYGSEPPPLDGYDFVYLVDFSYPLAVVQTMLENNPRLRVHFIDHHVTAVEDLKPLNGHPRFHAFTDMGRSGAGLAWEFLFPTTAPPTMLNYVQDRDLWHWKLPMSKETSAYIAGVKKSFDAWDILMLGGDDITKHARWAALGQALLEKDQKTCEEIARGAIILSDFDGHQGVPLCNCPGEFASNVGHILSEAAPFSITYHFAHNKMLVSLRSRSDTGVDVGSIARKFGGGGHKHAAGFTRTYNGLADLFSWLAGEV